METEEMAFSEDMSQYPEPDPQNPPFPWMGSYQPVPVESFPRAQGPIVHEGFVPDAEAMASENAHDSQANPLQATWQRSDGLSRSEEPLADFSGDDGPSMDSNDETNQSIDENMSLDDDVPEEEFASFEDNALSIDAQPRRRGRPKGSWSAARGRRRGRGPGRGGKGIKRGPRAALEPSSEFLALQKEAINIFIDEQDHDRALALIQEAIAINPEIYSAHTLLSEIYFAKGDDEKAVAALFSGAHAAPRDANVWQQVADACLQRTALDRNRALEQAIYCFARLVDINPKDHDSRFQRAAINRELGNFGKAMKDLEKLLEEMPHNPSILRQVAEVCIESGQIDRAKSLYEESIAHHRSSQAEAESGFSWSDVNVYVELFGHLGQYDQGIAALKSLSRWLLGRGDECYWDEIMEDDREYDASDEPRRVEVLNFTAGYFPSEAYGDGLPLELRVKLGIYRLRLGREHRNEAFAHFEWLEPEDDALGTKVFDYSDLFRETGDALKAEKEYEEALRYYEPIKDHAIDLDTDFWLAIAASSYVCGKHAQAIECYEAAKASDSNCAEARTQLSKLYKDAGDRDKALVNAHEALEISRRTTVRTQRRRYERKDQRETREAAEKALKEAHKMPIALGSTKIDFKASHSLWDPSPSSNMSQMQQYTSAESRPHKRRRRQLMSVEEVEFRRTSNIQNLYATLQNLTPSMREGDLLARNTWLDCASELIADFRSVRVFYPHERHITFQGYDRESKEFAAKKRWQKDEIREARRIAENAQRAEMSPQNEADIPLPSTEPSIPNEYRGIHFNDWLDIFLEAALVLARKDKSYKEQCYTILNAAIDCTIWYHEPDSMLQIYVCYFSCALALNDAVTLSNVVGRWFMRQYAFCTDAYRLFSALNLMYMYPNEKSGKDGQMQNAVWRLGPSQKFLFRQVKAIDALLPDDYNVNGEDGPVPTFMRAEAKTIEKEDEQDKAMTDDSRSAANVKPKEMDVVLLSLYAQILYAGGSFPNALSYYYRAYALDPKNPMVLLSIALSYIHQMVKRQNENRHMYLMQGLAFFEEYATCRVAKGLELGSIAAGMAEKEVHFNQARIWQSLGLSDLAVRGYGKVLGQAAVTKRSQNGDQDGDKPDSSFEEDYSLEAAYAAQTLYALSGDIDSARAITEKWLVVD